MSTDPASAPDGLRDPFPSPSPARARFPRRTALPDYLPARMVNEFVYCPRLFFYEWVEGVFAHSSDTIEGALRHEKLETKHDAMPAPEASGETIHARSVQLSSETHRLIAVIDLVEGDGQRVTPVDYKRGAPRDGADGPEAWDADRAQVCAQALILRDNGYHCDEAVLYYNKTKQRVRVAIDEALVAETLAAITGCRSTAEAHRIPPPLVDSPKCPRCSLVSICLPDETAAAMWLRDSHDDGEQLALFGDERTGGVNAPDLTNADAREPRRLMPARDDLRPLYVTGYGISIGKSGEVLQVREKKVLIKEVRLNEVSQVNVFGNISVTAPAVQGLCSAEKPIAYFSTGGWFYGLTQGLGLRNVFLRRDQFRRADDRAFCVRVAREIVATKIRNQRTLLQRNHVEPPARIQQILKQLSLAALRTEDLDVLLGIEGAAARTYFEQLSGMLKPDDDEAAPAFDFTHRNRRPPRDPVNALLSMAYSLLVRDLTTVCHSIGFDPFIGFYHQPRFGRPALALDLMEGFRPIIADSAVLTVINTGMVTASDFVRVGPAVSLAASGRKALIRAYEQRMDNLVTHPLFGYRVSYRRGLEI